ncbi:MAG: hypothetical protein AMJ65_02120 [Phycisphaerae bacterium SG8_4]|nr:MAG: hypothetical protein AMJ65_02120 [Phycisphaerae bacterium SG8_4]
MVEPGLKYKQKAVPRNGVDCDISWTCRRKRGQGIFTQSESEEPRSEIGAAGDQDKPGRMAPDTRLQPECFEKFRRK